jgi:serine-type D-Ala-D-Ala carboxypeptidase/endopeptidase (penicillin-binding protein 4)
MHATAATDATDAPDATDGVLPACPEVLVMVGKWEVTSKISPARVVPSRAAAVGLLAAISLLAPALGSQTPPAPSGDRGVSAPAPSAAPSKVSDRAPELRAAVDALATRVQELGGVVGVAIMDVGTGETLAMHAGHKALNPASNAKVLTAATALARLRPSHRYHTALYGKAKGGRSGSLVLRGSGDPSLATADLWELARELKDAGVKRVDGDILVDQRFFDDQFVPPAFDQQPNEWAAFRAPVSAVAVNGNTVTLTVRPGASGGPASASFDPPGFVDVDGSVKTVDGGAQSVGLSLKPSGTRLAAHLSGSIPESSRSLSFTKRVDNPQLLAGYVLKSVLAELGISVSGEVKQGGDKVKSSALAVHRSRPLAQLLYELGKQSDNFYAEMVFKSLALEQKGRPARAGHAADVVTAFLAEVGVAEEGDVVKNGSGLFDANRVTAVTLARLLRVGYREPSWGSEFVAQLAVGGQDGTLRSRYRKARARGVVRAKTGTLEGAATLSGFVLAPAGKDPISFSILINGVPGKVSQARVAIDKCVEAVVNHLWK